MAVTAPTTFSLTQWRVPYTWTPVRNKGSIATLPAYTTQTDANGGDYYLVTGTSHYWIWNPDPNPAGTTSVGDANGYWLDAGTSMAAYAAKTVQLRFMAISSADAAAKAVVRAGRNETQNPGVFGTPINDWGTAPTATPMPVGNITNFRQVAAQDFTASVAEGGFLANANGDLVVGGLAGYNAYGAGSGAAKLTVYPKSWAASGTRTSNGNGIWDETTTLSVSGSCLNIRLHSEDYAGTMMPRAAAVKPVLSTGNYKLGAYGKYEYRIRTINANATPTNFHVLCLAIDSNAWYVGELDFIETDAQGTLNGWYHYLTTSPRNAATNDPKIRVTTSRPMSTWTIVTVEWTPTRMRWGTRLDGENASQIIWHLDDSTHAIPNAAMPVLFQMEPTTTAPAPTTTATVQIDWFVAYEYDTTIP